MSRNLSWAAALLAAGCVTAKPAGTGDENETVIEKQKISNISYLDLAVCSPRALTLPSPVNGEALVGLLVAHRPEVMECLVDAKHRGPEAETRAVAEATVSELGATFKVSGGNLDASGQRCIESALGKLAVAPLAKGAAPATGRAEYVHTDASPSVRMGLNESSDVAGVLRLAAAGWCDCYAEWAGGKPRTLKVRLVLTSEGVGTLSPIATGDPKADRVGSCLVGKIRALPLPVKSSELTITYPFIFVSSGVQEDLETEAPDIRFIQLDAIRGQRAAETAIRAGYRVNAVQTYDGLVVKYRADAKSVPLPELKERCAALVKADDDWIAALQRQLEIDQRALALAVELEAKDLVWAAASAAAQKTVNDGQLDLAQARKVRAADEAVCPKERY